MCDCRNENTKGAERQLKFLVYNLEAACRAADEAGCTACTLLLPLRVLLGPTRLFQDAALPLLTMPLPILPLPEQPQAFTQC